VGCNLKHYDKWKLADQPCGAPLILWNQRWEYDKDPGTMLRALYALAEMGVQYRVALAGENFRVLPGEFSEARERLGGRLVHYGYAADAGEYAHLLWQADLVLSTALHEFFGVSIVEAMYCGCVPIVPHRLSYPELIPAALHQRCLYDDFAGLIGRLKSELEQQSSSACFREAAERFDWSIQGPAYDQLMEEVAAGG
jgi:glycosyltransferase involved in cell wall biosynthesis